MSFASPVWFLGLLVLPLGWALARAAAARKRRHAIRLPSTPTLVALLAATPSWRRHLPPALLALAVVALVGALAKPRTSVAVPVKRATIMLVVDASRSMQSTDVDPSRLAAVQQAATRFVDSAPRELEIGFLGFSDEPFGLQKPTRNRSVLRQEIALLQADGGTDTGDALMVALQSLPRGSGPVGAGANERPPSAIILLSDGKQTSGIDAETIARQAGARRVPIFTIALGTPDGTVPGGPFGVQAVPPDPQSLGDIAKDSGGQLFQADQSGDLQKVYTRLGQQVASRREHRERTVFPAAIALVLLAGAVATRIRIAGRL